MSTATVRREVGFRGLDCAALAAPLVVVLAFLIASGNARWFFWSGLFPSLLIPPLLLILSLRDPSAQLRIPLRSLPLVAGLAAMTVIAGASAVAVDPSQRGIVQWIGTYVSLLLVYLGCVATPFNRRLATATWVALTLGALIPLIAGVLAYYREWGFPTAVEVLTSRYDMQRMSGYMDATYGNTGNTAALLALLTPAWLAVAAARGIGRKLRLLCAAATVIALTHALIVESRTLFIVLVLLLLPVAYYHRRPLMAAVGLALAAALYYLLPLMAEAEALLQETFGRVADNAASDQSVEERTEAMRIGLKVMLDNPALGVGPGNSPKVNMYTSAHQFWINQGQEIGLLGLALSALISLAIFWRLLALLRARPAGPPMDPIGNLRFAAMAGACGYIFYGCIANMPLSATVVNVWVGLLAIMLAMSDVTFTDARRATADPVT
jgi:O-antigen ligase